jgi:hypothetical protein
MMERGSSERRETAEGGWLDAEVRDSFPASDPLSHWAGPVRAISDADRAHHFADRAAARDSATR